jgi:pimeloyl-ACP methyl ester carboxylesterase
MQIDSNGLLIFYSKTGQGVKNLLLFHGYGQDHSIFDELCQSIGKEYTCFCFDIPFHGRTEWNHGENPLTKEEWQSILTSFFAAEQIDDFCLLGFSIGARFSLATFEAFPDRTREIFFIAPDGISMNFWYSLASYPWATRKLFKSLIHKPAPFFALSKVAGKLRLVNRKVLRFAEHEMKSEHKRSTVYYTWVVTRKLKFNITALAKELNRHGTKVYVVIGKYDPLINKSQVQTLLSALEKPNLILLPSGHHKLLHSIAQHPEKVFYSGK